MSECTRCGAEITEHDDPFAIGVSKCRACRRVRSITVVVDGPTWEQLELQRAGEALEYARQIEQSWSAQTKAYVPARPRGPLDPPDAGFEGLLGSWRAATAARREAELRYINATVALKQSNGRGSRGGNSDDR